MPMTAQEAIRRLKREGWTEVRQTGSHKQFKKDGKRLTVPDHNSSHALSGRDQPGQKIFRFCPVLPKPA